MKKCKKCHTEKPLTDFYKHVRALGGRLNECKECTKSRTRAYRAANIEKVREYDRQRGQDPKRLANNRINYRKRISTPEGKKRERERQSFYQKNRQSSIKRAANIMLGNALNSTRVTRPGKCQKCGYTTKLHGHHEDYYAPLDVVWLCRACHGARHRKINQAIRDGEDWSDRGF